MSASFSETWLPRILCAGTLAVAALLGLTVLAAPWLAATFAPSGWLGQLLTIFAHDAMVRRTALVSSIGLVVTAVVFFRPGTTESSQKPRSPKIPTHGNIAGA